MRSVAAKLAVLTGGLVLLAAVAGCSGPAQTNPWEGSPSGGDSSDGGVGDGSAGASGSGSSSGSGSGSSRGGSGSGSGSGGASGSSSSGSSGGSSSGGGSGSGSSGGSSGGGSGGAADGGTSPFDQFQQHNLDVINMYRAMGGVPPLTLDTQLSAFALAGSQELSMDHLPHQHFIDASNSGTLWTSGFVSQAGENQGDPNGWPMASTDPTTNEMEQIDQIIKAMYDEGPGTGEAHGHYNNIMNVSGNYTRLGVGLLEVNGMLYLTNDFSD
jgi:hypothetical protein